jgi:hypothetical protein
MSDEKQEVVVTNIKIPFTSMVVLLVKLALASIPALIILFFIFGILGIIFGGWFHGRFWMT